MHTFFGLPSIELKGETLYPEVINVLLGWARSFCVAQTIQEGMIKELSLDQEQAVQKGGTLIEPICWGIYIED